MKLRSFGSRALLAAVVAVASLTAPAIADLGPAMNFAVLSSSNHLAFGSADLVYKIPTPNGPTCPTGTGCPIFVGGTAITHGSNERIYAHPTTSVSAAGFAANAYATFLASQHPTRTTSSIVLKPGTSSAIKLSPGLNVILLPAIFLGNVNVAASDPCAKSTGDPAVLEIYGSSSDTAVFNIGGAGHAGALMLCDGSRIVLDGGITPDRVTFNVAGRSNLIALGAGALLNGQILAPLQGFFSENSNPGAPPMTVNGAILAGGPVTIGANAVVKFYPTQNVGVPATVKKLGTVNTSTLPPPVARTTNLEKEDNPAQPSYIPHPVRPNTRGTTLSELTPMTTGARRRGLRLPHLTQANNFAGAAQNGFEPSDVQFAAGTSELVEMVNTEAAFYTNPGGTLINTVDLGSFWLGSPGQGTDPRIFYDAASGNFFAAYEMSPAGGDDIRLAVAPNPGTSWTIYDVANNNTGTTFDQPKLGVSSDKITISWNNYGSQKGCSYIVIQKAGVIALANTVPAWIWTDDTSRFQVVPANSLSNDGGTQYGGWRCCGSSNFDLMAFTGVPGVSPVNFTDNAYGIGSVSGPPSGRQPSGGSATINTNDDRLLSAVWQYNKLWGNFNEGCTPTNDRSKRACERYVEIGTPGAGVLQNAQLQWTGNDIYYSSVTLDSGNSDRGSADLFFGLTYSSTSQDPAALVLEVPGSAFTPTTGAIIELAGSAAYSGGRWGDYTAAGRDPNDPTKVWIVNQYGGTSSYQGWGTSITEIGN